LRRDSSSRDRTEIQQIMTGNPRGYSLLRQHFRATAEVNHLLW
jgi:hypothetical protein